jgi:hypothetical protein
MIRPACRLTYEQGDVHYHAHTPAGHSERSVARRNHRVATDCEIDSIYGL